MTSVNADTGKSRVNPSDFPSSWWFFIPLTIALAFCYFWCCFYSSEFSMILLKLPFDDVIRHHEWGYPQNGKAYRYPFLCMFSQKCGIIFNEMYRATLSMFHQKSQWFYSQVSMKMVRFASHRIWPSSDYHLIPCSLIHGCGDSATSG